MKKLILLFLIVSFSKNYAQTDYSFVYNTDSILQKGAKFYNSKNYDQALLEYKKITKIDPKYLNAQYEIGLTLYAQDKKVEFTELMESLYNQDKMSNFPELFQMYGIFLSNEKEYEKSEIIFKEGEKFLPNSSSFLYNFAVLYIRKKETQKGVDILEKIINNNPNYASAHYLLGSLAFENGKITEGTLAFMTYLILEPTGSYASQAVLGLNANYGENYLSQSTVVFSKSGDNFKDIDIILRNQLPLKKVYKIQSSIDDRITRQMQAVAEYAVTHKMGNGFFENSYIPWVKELVEKNQFEGYTYFSLLSMEDKIGKELNKQKKKIILFRDNYLLKDFWSVFGKRKQELFGEVKEVMVSINKEKPFIIGVQVNGEFEGKCKYLNYYENLAGELNFKNGKLNGLQKYFNEKGILTEEKNFLNGKLDGKRTTYYKNGNIEMIENYKEDLLEGISTSYHPNGGKNCEVNFTNNLKNGVLICLSRVGNKLTEIAYLNGKINGKYTTYNELGALTESYTCVEDQIEGNYFEYYDGKILKSEAFYKNNQIQGSYKSYYTNATLSLENSYLSGKISKSIDYYENGKKSNESFYNDKGELETYSYFDNDGNKYFEEKFKSNELKAAFQFSKNNTKATEVNVTKKAFEMKNFDNSLKIKGAFEKGKKSGEWSYFYRSGTLRLNEFYIKGKTNGVAKNYNANGDISTIINYKQDTINGVYERYYINKINQLFNYENGIANGPFKTFYTNGNISTEGYLIDSDVTYEKFTYSQTGEVSTIDNYIEDVMIGRKTFSQKGKLENEINYTNKTGSFNYSFNNGVYSNTFELKNGILNGKFVAKDKFKTPIIESEYLNNSLNNSYKSYSPVGSILTEKNYYCGKLNGLNNYYDYVGNLRFSQEYIYGVENGKTIRYFYNKSKLSESTQQNDATEGDKTYYNQKGEALLIVHYQNNEAVNYTRKSKTGELNDTIIIEKQTAEILSIYPNGKIAIQFKLNKGNNHGDFIINNIDGKIEFKCTYNNNSLEGERIEYYTNGKLYKKERFANNEYNGLQEYFKEDGKLWAVISLKNDELDGNSLLYKVGKLVQTKKYDSDELVEIIK